MSKNFLDGNLYCKIIPNFQHEKTTILQLFYDYRNNMSIFNSNVVFMLFRMTSLCSRPEKFYFKVQNKCPPYCNSVGGKIRKFVEFVHLLFD